MTCQPLQNPTLGVSVPEGVMSLDSKQGSGPPKPRCEALCQGLHGTGVVIAVLLTIPSGHQAVPHHTNAFHLYGALQVVSLFPISCGTKMEHGK
jgi:hypothetical protein